MGYTSQAMSFKIPVRMRNQALEIFNYLASAPVELKILEFGVFGSVARGCSRYDSDLDIAVVSDGDLKQLRLYCSSEQCLDRQDISVDIVFLPKSWTKSNTFFHRKVREDYIPIWKVA